MLFIRKANDLAIDSRRTPGSDFSAADRDNCSSHWFILASTLMAFLWSTVESIKTPLACQSATVAVDIAMRRIAPVSRCPLDVNLSAWQFREPFLLSSSLGLFALRKGV